MDPLRRVTYTVRLSRAAWRPAQPAGRRPLVRLRCGAAYLAGARAPRYMPADWLRVTCAARQVMSVEVAVAVGSLV